jgi:AcrR family transcriptional regulator
MNAPIQSEPRRGRPRSEKAREAILDAAGELLLGRGLSEVSMDAVAARAGVSKATIYRWWRTKEALALDTLYHEWDTARPSMPDTGTLRSDLLSYLRPWVRRASTRPVARVVAELVAAVHASPEFCDLYQARFVEPRRAPARAFFERALERGEVPPIDVDLALDFVFGPIYHRLLHAHAPLNDRFIEQVVDALMLGLPSMTENASMSENASTERVPDHA